MLSILRANSLPKSAHRALVRIHLAEGNLSEARRAYIACEQLLCRELGVAPTAAMTSLLARFPVGAAIAGGPAVRVRATGV